MSNNPGPKGGDLSSRLAQISLDSTTGYPSIPPPGSSPAAQQHFSNVHTPTGRGSPSYSPRYVDETGQQYMYYTPNPTALGPPFSPAAPPPPNNGHNHANQSYDYDGNDHHGAGQQQHMNAEMLLEGNFPLGDAFHSPEARQMAQGRGRVGGQMASNSNNMMFRPSATNMQQATMQQQAAMAQYYNYNDQRQMWWAQQHMVVYPPTSVGGDRKKDHMDSLQSQNVPYTPMTRMLSQPQSSGSYGTPHSEYIPAGLTSPHLSNNFGLVTPGTPAYRPHMAGATQYMHNSHGAYSPAGFPSTPYSPVTSHTRGLSLGLGPRKRPDEAVLPVPPRSALLEDFRINKMQRRWELKDIFDHVVEFSGDQHGSRFIQQRLETSSAEDKEKVFEEILPNAYQLMTDVFGNYVIQKMLELGDQRQKASLAKRMEGHVVALSMQMYGCRVVQKALEHVLVDQRKTLIAEIEPHVLECVKSSNANHVIQRLVCIDPPRSITRSFVGHVIELSMNPYGCRVLQRMFETFAGDMKRELLDEILPHAVTLMEDQFGNYVVQSIITTGSDVDRDAVISQIKGNMLPMSRHKFASNVCEKALRHGNAADRRELITELVNAKTDGSNAVGMLLHDAFGNYSLQTALKFAENDQREELLKMIIPVVPQIRHTPVGKRVEAMLIQWEDEGQIPPGSYTRNTDRVHTHQASLSSSTNTTDSGYTPRTISGSSSTGNTSPALPHVDRDLRSSASTPIRHPVPSQVRGASLDKTDSKATMVGQTTREGGGQDDSIE